MEYNVNSDDNYSSIRFYKGKRGGSIMSIGMIIYSLIRFYKGKGGGVECNVNSDDNYSLIRFYKGKGGEYNVQ